MPATPSQTKKRPAQRAAAPAAALGLAPAAGLFTAPDGTDVYFEDSGGPGPVLFYIYGLGCSIRHWKYPLAHFEPAAAGAAGRRPHRQVWLDFRGHGKSPPPPRGQRLTMPTIIGDVRSLCAHRGISAATFLGQSMGGSIVLALAHAAPALVRGLVLLASPGRDVGRYLPAQPLAGAVWGGLTALNRRVPMVFRVARALSGPLLHNPMVVAAAREVVRHGGFNPALARTDDIDEYIRKVLEVDPVLFFDMADALRTFDVAALAPPVACPALVIAGGNDQVVPLFEAERLAAHLPHGELEVVAHGSHCPHFDDPGLVNRRIERFLDLHGL